MGEGVSTKLGCLLSIVMGFSYSEYLSERIFSQAAGVSFLYEN